MRRSRIIIVCVLALTFTVSAFLGLTGAVSEIESTVHTLLNPSGETGRIFKAFTDIGEAAGVIAVIVVFLVIPATRLKVGLPLSATVFASLIISKAVKLLVARQRPVERLISVTGYSFPSGHAMNNAALYIGILLLLTALCKNRTQRSAVAVICIFMTLMIGISRVYFNVHYLSDVICGWSLGSAVAVTSSEIYFNISNKRRTINEAHKG